MRRRLYTRSPGGLAGKMILLITAFGLVLVALLVYSYVYSSRVALSDARERFKNHAVHLSSQLTADLTACSATADELARFIEVINPPEATLLVLLRTAVEHNHRIFGSTAAYEPYAFSPDRAAYSPYFCRRDGRLRFVQLGAKEYNYFDKDWFTGPKRTGRSLWTEPYFDRGGGDVLMATYSAPFFSYPKGKGKDGQFRGVVTADVSVEDLTKRLKNFRPENSGFCFLISRKGAFLVPPPRGFRYAESIFEAAFQPGRAALTDVGRRMLEGDSGFMDVGTGLTPKSSLLAWATVPATGWSLGLVAPREEILAEVSELYTRQMIVAGLVVLGALAAAVILAHSIARPLRTITTATERIAAGDLNVEVPRLDTSDEISLLAESFNRMTEDLKRYIRDLTETTAAKQRMESELEIAARIQKSMLPSASRGYGDREEFDVYAVMEPAKQVGGDFYDFFLVDEDHLCVAVGDVADKGVPAALYMAVVIYLVHSAAGRGTSPHEILAAVNEQICRDNDSCVFVTAFCGVLNIRTGEFRFSNAGHEPPILVGPGAATEDLPVPPGPALGLLEDAQFKTGSLFFEPGQTVLAYTDGVTEALNERNEQYSQERLKTTLEAIVSACADTSAQAVLSDLQRFRAGAERFDDITLLALSYRPK